MQTKIFEHYDFFVSKILSILDLITVWFVKQDGKLISIYRVYSWIKNYTVKLIKKINKDLLILKLVKW